MNENSANEKLVVTAFWQVNPGEEGAIAGLLKQFLPEAQREPGVKEFQIHQNTAKPNEFFFYEVFAGEAAFAAHVRPEAFDATISIDLAFMFHWARRAIPALPCFVTQKYIANMALYPVSPFGATISGQAMNVETDMQTIM